jgi:RHS repeat-associated protein
VARKSGGRGAACGWIASDFLDFLVLFRQGKSTIYLNLPKQIQISMNGLNHINYLYDAAGTKLAKHTLEDGVPQHTTDYIGSFVYEDGELQYLLTTEGRVVFAPDGTHDYQYFLKDHLGNTRVTFNASGIIQEDSFYPFGMAMAGLSDASGLDLPNKYLYNGKELQDDFGLDWYDYGARFYDAQLGRWHVVDPLSEKYYNYSHYAYVYNNPLLFYDLNGEEGFKTTRKNNDGSKTVTFTLNLKVKNSAGMSRSQVETSANAIAKQTQSSFQGYDKETNTHYETVVNLDFDSEVSEGDFYIDFVSDVKNQDGSDVIANGKVDEIGNVESNRFQVLAIGESDCLPCDDMTEEKQPTTGAHELGHGMGLKHEEIGTDESSDGIPVPPGNLMRGYSGGQGTNINSQQLKKVETIMPEKDKNE